MVQAPPIIEASALPEDVATRRHRLKARAPSFTSSPLRASLSARAGANGSDSESDRSDPIDIPHPIATSPPHLMRPSTFTPASQAGKSWISAHHALDAPVSPDLGGGGGGSTSPPYLAPRTPPSASSIKASRRRSSTSLLDVSSISPARSSLVGSYEQSLLSGRMSSLPSRPFPFLAEIGILGGAAATQKGKVKLPPHLHLEFGAVYYQSSSEVAASSSPYVGAIDLEQHYLDDLLAARVTNALGLDPNHPAPSVPRFPGYRLPSATGQIQLIIKHPNKTPAKLFLVPYDLSHLEPGQKTFIRQKMYLDDGGPLQYAVHLPFCAPPPRAAAATSSSSSSSSSRRSNAVRIYLHGTIRVVFHATAVRAPSERLHAHYDQPEPSDYAGPSEEWNASRRPSLASSAASTPFDPDGADVIDEHSTIEADDSAENELSFARRPCTPSVGNLSGLSGSRPGTPKQDDALR